MRIEGVNCIEPSPKLVFPAPTIMLLIFCAAIIHQFHLYIYKLDHFIKKYLPRIIQYIALCNSNFIAYYPPPP
jgi:hypothetical protein